MKKFVYLPLALIFAFCAPSTNQAFSQDVETTTIYSSSPPAVRLDSWMEPAVSRTRVFKDGNGDTHSVTEPIIMERHERVMMPMGQTITTRDTRYGGQVVRKTESSTESSSVSRTGSAPVRRVANHRRYRTASSGSRRKYVAKRTVTETAPTVIRHEERVVDKAVIIERRDPLLNVF